MGMKRKLFWTSLLAMAFSYIPLSAIILLDDVMSREEQYKTGVDKLNAKQKTELEKWLNENFELKKEKTTPVKREVFLSVNINDGKQLRLSDGSLYEVAPSDTIYSASWITPFPLDISPSGDPDYPFRITNTGSGTSVKAKQIEPPSP